MIFNCKLPLFPFLQNKLSELLPYLSDYADEVSKRIHNSMCTISSEILSIYHNTRNKNNSEIYNALPTTFRKVLYDLHGIYISKINIIQDNSNKLIEPNSLNIHDVYYYLKNLQFGILKKIFYDRLMIIKENQSIPFINKNCIYALTQSSLMFNINI